MQYFLRNVVGSKLDTFLKLAIMFQITQFACHEEQSFGVIDLPFLPKYQNFPEVTPINCYLQAVNLRKYYEFP